MCSVIGVYSKKGEDVSHEAYKLLASLSRRGPEGFGVKTQKEEKKSVALKGLLPLPTGSIILGHCLLSTTGFAVQPITHSKISIAHNGQIYNYNEINTFQKKPSSDSEVIAKFFSKGLQNKNFSAVAREFFSKVEGEFAVGALYGNKLYAFRDFLGLKPLWYGENNSLIAFASGPGALMKIGIQFPQPLLPGYLLEISKKGAFTKPICTLADFKKSVPKKHPAAALRREFERAMDLQCAGLKKAAVLFSGGVDSSLIAKAVSQRVGQTVLFVAGVEGSDDIKNADTASRELGLVLEKIILSEEEIKSLSLKCMKILSFFDEMQIGLAVPELACAGCISKMGFKVVFSGQGSDEIFCGYSSYAKSLEIGGYLQVNSDIWASLSRMWSRNFYRDDAIISSCSLELRVPFMAGGFLREALAIPAQQKILSVQDPLRKHPLRELAKSYGLSDYICLRPKKSMQYGSGVQKIVSKLLN